ncbi:MAG: hypothetical protein LBB49_04305 [Gracilibacteraceae bacterium]|jgi:hypothetical protein|nr:hypothetical protein [Gracilibacteraceae bacterium]
MMLSLHASIGIASSLYFINGKKRTPSVSVRISPNNKTIAVAFVSNIALHGAMDLLPHSHPIPSYLDGIIALLAVFLLFCVKSRYRILVFSCYMGGVIPDIIDLGVFRVLHINSFKIFPWHFTSVFDILNELYTNASVNMLFNVWIFAACIGIVIWKRKRLCEISFFSPIL